MSQWFYAEDNRERRGPLPAENIAELFRSGRIAADTLVWREGAPDWQPLSTFANELGLELESPGAAPEGPQPPAMPIAPPPAPPAPPMAAPAVTTAPAVPPRQGLSGCAIAGIIVAVVGLVLVALLGILAAIAVPTYQEYVQRSRTAMAYGQLIPLKLDVAGFVHANDRCPVNGDEGFGSPESYASSAVASVRIGRFDNGHCGLEARLLAPNASAVDGKTLWLDYDTETAAWECSSDVADKYLPLDCRG